MASGDNQTGKTAPLRLENANTFAPLSANPKELALKHKEVCFLPLLIPYAIFSLISRVLFCTNIFVITLSQFLLETLRIVTEVMYYRTMNYYGQYKEFQNQCLIIDP